jgi:hypothetical protein
VVYETTRICHGMGSPVHDHRVNASLLNAKALVLGPVDTANPIKGFGIISRTREIVVPEAKVYPVDRGHVGPMSTP